MGARQWAAGLVASSKRVSDYHGETGTAPPKAERSSQSVLGHLLEDAVQEAQTKNGRIRKDARVLHCGVIRNVNIGPAAVLDGIQMLENGTIRSDPADPAFVGAGVIANDFIFCEGSNIRNNVILRRCFVGQSTELSRSFTAQDSAFFANCSMGQGQAYSVFAGPFSVSQHKSTLLIAGLCSFFNAGSGTNPSNHNYRLGPNQQGIFSRQRGRIR